MRGLVSEINEKIITLKAPYVQLKALQHEEIFYLYFRAFSDGDFGQMGSKRSISTPKA
jgi:hypothetical protein